MAAVLEQALAADLKERGAADGEAPAEGVGGQPDRVVHGGSGGGLPGAAGEATEIVCGRRLWIMRCARCIDSGLPGGRLTMALRSEIHR